VIFLHFAVDESVTDDAPIKFRPVLDDLDSLLLSIVALLDGNHEMIPSIRSTQSVSSDFTDLKPTILPNATDG
jgi:hypothetical protein